MTQGKIKFIFVVMTTPAIKCTPKIAKKVQLKGMCVQFISKAKLNISESMYYRHFILAFRGENTAQLPQILYSFAYKFEHCVATTLNLRRQLKVI